MNAHDITATLQSLDPVDRSMTTSRLGERQAQTWTRIQHRLASEPSGEPVRRQRRAGRRRIVLATGTLVAATVAIAVPAVTGGGDQAFATWTGTPKPLTVRQRAAAVSDCRTAQAHGAGADNTAMLDKAEPVIAERRGAWSTVVLADTDGFSALCITDDSAHLFDKGMIGSIGTLSQATPTGRRDLTATDLGTGTIRGHDISLAAGTAGAEVAAVTYRSPSRGDVRATVSHQHFAFWLPGAELRNAATAGVTVEIRYRDGSTATSQLHL